MARHIYLNENRSLADYMPEIDRLGTTSHAHFDSIGDCVRYLQSTPRESFWAPYFWARSELVSITANEACEMALYGWRDGADRVARLRDKIAAKQPAAQRISQWDVAGALPSIPRYYAGNPLFMRRMATVESRKRPVLTLINHMGGNSDVPEHCFINRAAVIATIVDVVESAGYSLHVIGASYSANSRFAHETAVTLKEAGAHMDIGIMAFALGHAGFFRRIVFGVRCADSVNSPLTTTLGSTCDYAGRPDHCFVLPSMNSTYSFFETEQSAESVGLAAMIATLASQGCPAFREHASFISAA